MFVKLNGPPQPRMIFGTCLAYSESVELQVVVPGALVQFPPPAALFVALPSLVRALLPAADNVNQPATANGANKRQCIRSLDGGGEPTETTSSHDRGTSRYLIYDLDGNSYVTRNKADIIPREMALGFPFRTVDPRRRIVLMGRDYILQSEAYRVMCLQQGRTRLDQRLEAYESCGHMDRIQGIDISRNPEKCKLLLTGQVLVEGSTSTLTLDDFVDGTKISSGTGVCLEQNRPMVAMLRNLQLILHIFLSSQFENCFEPFILDLEGAERPLQLVAADFMLYSVEETLRKFFHLTSTARTASSMEEVDLRTPEECATFMVSLFDQLSVDLADHQQRTLDEDYFRVRKAREAIILQSAVKTPTPSKKEAVSRPCAGHLGKQLKAVYADGRPYQCNYGKSCMFEHIGKSGKTAKDIKELILRMPASAQDDLLKAAKKKN